MTPDTVNVLWTSGWDSTFRVASLLLVEGKVVQPWYIRDSGRRSAKVELQTMEKIRASLIKKDPTVEERLLPTIIIPIEDIPADVNITRRYKELLQRSFLGSQHDWLPRFASWQGIDLELSIHRDDNAHDFLVSSVRKLEDGTYRLAKTEDAALSIYSPFIFPLFDITKLEMQEFATEKGFADIMNMTWFCFNPLLDGTPCGNCNPCRYTTEEGLGRRIPAPSVVRTVQAKVLGRTWGIQNKGRRFIAKFKR